MKHLSTPSETVKAIAGRKLAYRLRGVPLKFRLQLAADLVASRVQLIELTVKQACALAGVTPASFNRNCEAERIALRAVRRARELDRLIDRVIAKGGTDRLVDRLDALTAPAAVAAE
jgi:hypothetical protein